MVYRIGKDCINCGACAQDCPEQCIHDGEDYYFIDEEKCINCGTCAEVCPVGAPEEV
ncbi:MAG: 4Fe-4S binding protein [Firmicutes bacterium]|nr:4Fe-4S binding protein [Bacillota bacterium]